MGPRGVAAAGPAAVEDGEKSAAGGGGFARAMGIQRLGFGERESGSGSFLFRTCGVNGGRGVRARSVTPAGSHV